MSPGKPTWALVMDAATELTRTGGSPFSLDALIKHVQRIDPSRGRESISPIVQGMTINAPGGPKSACGEVLHRVDRGMYELTESPSTSPEGGGQPGTSFEEATDDIGDDLFDDPIAFLIATNHSWQADPQLAEIITARDEVIGHYGQVFAPPNLQHLTAEEFKSFLLYENNRHWWGIHRHQTSVTADMVELRRVLELLVDESHPIDSRLDQIVRPGKANVIPGLGKAVLTPILFVVYPDRYGVWNSIAESAMKRLGLWPSFDRGASFGESYSTVNRVLIETAQDVGVDLWTLDSLWWATEQTPVLGQVAGLEAVASGLDSLTRPGPDLGDFDLSFSLERHLHDFLRDNWNRTELGNEWELFTEGGDLVGYEYPTSVGRIDLLAHHRAEPRWLVVELKRDRSSDRTVGQVARYVGWIRENLAEESDTVEGLVIAHSADEKIRYALAVVPDISLKTYEVDFRLRDTPR